MSRLLSELLMAEEPLFGMAIQRLEQASGNAGVDVRLTAEIVGKVHIKLRSLGLDPRDTTGRELYHALYALVRQHDQFLADRIGVRDSGDVAQVLQRVKETAEALDVPRKAWVLKPSSAKRLLKATPPKHVMKQLGYRSVDSMLKRESIGELFGALRFLESEQWLTKFVAKYKTLRPSDFESRAIEIVYYDPEKWGSVISDFSKRKRHNITHLKEMGVVAIMPLPMQRLPGLTIVALPTVLHYMNEIRLYSAFFKAQQVKPNFSEIIIDTLLSDPGKHVSVAGHHLHWRVIHRHFAREDREHPSLFEPHVEPDDLIWRKTEETLYRLEPALHFWYDIDYVGVRSEGGVVPLNLMDMAVNFVNQLGYGSQTCSQMQSALWNEIYLRYVGEQAVEKHILTQLDRDFVGPDIIAVGLHG